jgi:hypothetical protein
MTVRCDQCGHENNPEYRFCGMCGAPLAPVSATREPERTRVSPVGGPSFLGLGDDRSNDLDYLMEDEPPETHGRWYLALILLGISGGLLAWHWQRDGYPWAVLNRPSASNKAPASAASNPDSEPSVAPISSTASSPSAATSAPTPNPESSENAPANAMAAGQVAQTPSGESAGGAGSPSSIEVIKPADPTAGASGIASSPDSAASPAAALQGPAPKGASVPLTGASSTPPARTAPETPAQEAPEPTPAAPSKTPAAAKPTPTIPAVSPEDRLVDEGERYLYGRGVRADCALAQRDLMIGARASNPKAQTLLGAMYATGHCVSRDLPTAYRWFAKALHGDPGNSRVQRDLEVLWKQMTPEEKQLAMKSQ